MDPLTLGLASSGLSLIGQGISSLFGNSKKEDALEQLKKQYRGMMYDSKELDDMLHMSNRASNTSIANAMNNFALEGGSIMNQLTAKSSMMAPMLAQQSQEQSRIQLSAIDHNKNIQAKIAEAEYQTESSKESIDFGEVLSSGIQGYGLGAQIDYNKEMLKYLNPPKVGSITSEVLTNPALKSYKDPLKAKTSTLLPSTEVFGAKVDFFGRRI